MEKVEKEEKENNLEKKRERGKKNIIKTVEGMGKKGKGKNFRIDIRQGIKLFWENYIKLSVKRLKRSDN